MFQNTVWCSLELNFMNHLHVYSDLWQTVLPCKVTISHTLWLLHMGAHEGHGVQAETAVKRRTVAVNHGIGWLQNGEWWSYRSDRQKVTFEMYIIVDTWWWKSFWTVTSVPYLLSEVEVLQRNHLFQERQGTGLGRPLQQRMPSSPFSQLLCIAVTAFRISNTLGHPWLHTVTAFRISNTLGHPWLHAVTAFRISNTLGHPWLHTVTAFRISNTVGHPWLHAVTAFRISNTVGHPWLHAVTAFRISNTLGHPWLHTVTAFRISNTLGHPWLQFLKQPRHPGKQAGSCQDLQWIKLIENSNTFTHCKRKRSTLQVTNGYEELLGQVWKWFLCIRCLRCDVKNVRVLQLRDKNQHRI